MLPGRRSWVVARAGGTGSLHWRDTSKQWAREEGTIKARSRETRATSTTGYKYVYLLAYKESSTNHHCIVYLDVKCLLSSYSRIGSHRPSK